MIPAILLSFTAILIVVTLLPLSHSKTWWVRVWDFPRLQLAFLAAGLGLGALVAAGAVPVIAILVGTAAAGCLVCHASWILPFTPLFPKPVRSARPSAGSLRVSLLAANVLMTNRDAGRLLALIRRHRPDVFVALETDRWWEERLETLQGDYPHAVRQPQDNLYGMHVYSRHPLENARVEFLVEKDVPSIHAEMVPPGGPRIALHFLHPAPPSPTENEESTERDAELILVGRRAARSTLPVIVTGDLNDVAWSRTTRLFRRTSGLLDPRIGRGLFNTFHVRWWFVRWPLDHLFHSRHFAVVEMRRLPDIGSDHFPILIRLAHEPGPAPEVGAG